jgi:hypothetical protein
MNGLGPQGPPRPNNRKNPVVYPFKGGDGAVTFSRQKSGEQTYDINVDGVAHYGMIPDWIADLRQIAGAEIITDLFNGAEGYLDMWERASGVPGPSCPTGRVTRAGYGPVRLGADWKTVLREAGQPWERPGSAFRWCRDADRRVVGAEFRAGRAALVGVFGPRTPARLLKGARELTHGLFKKRAGGGLVWVMRKYSLAIARANVVRTKVRARRAMRHAGL